MASLLFMEITTIAGATRLVSIDHVQFINLIATSEGNPDRTQFVMADGTLVEAITAFDNVKMQLRPVVP